MKQHSDLWHAYRADLAQRGTAAHAPHQLGNRPEIAMKDKTAIDQLRQQFRRLQGSVNYWNNAARAAQRGADKHTGQRKNHDLQRLAEFTNKALAANKQLDQIKTQLTELDPKGARARQLNALRSAIARANKDIAQLQHLADLPGQSQDTLSHYQAKLNTKRAKLAQLVDALNHERADNEAAAAKQQAIAEHRAIVEAAYSFNPEAPDAAQQLAEHDAALARHGLRRLDDSDIERHQPLKPRRPLH